MKLKRPVQTYPDRIVNIVCGDCAGEGLIPRLTLLAFRHGVSCCDECGGRSFQLRSEHAYRPKEVIDDEPRSKGTALPLRAQAASPHEGRST